MKNITNKLSKLEKNLLDMKEDCKTAKKILEKFESLKKKIRSVKSDSWKCKNCDSTFEQPKRNELQYHGNWVVDNEGIYSYYYDFKHIKANTRNDSYSEWTSSGFDYYRDGLFGDIYFICPKCGKTHKTDFSVRLKDGVFDHSRD